MNRVAVISDSLSPFAYFPLWHSYYGELFGFQHLDIVTYIGIGKTFHEYELGGIKEISHRYNDRKRTEIISSIVTTLPETYTAVIRVDKDEFAIPSPIKYKDLKQYVEKLSLPYFTAYGLNVIPFPKEPILKINQPILVKQRSYVHPVGTLNKTCITTIPLKWDVGFHFTSKLPKFDDLFLFHMKHADFNIRMKWSDVMSLQIEEDSDFKSYYRPDTENALSYIKSVIMYPQSTGVDSLYRSSFNEKFLKGIKYCTDTQIYDGIHMFEEACVKIDKSFEGFF